MQSGIRNSAFVNSWIAIGFIAIATLILPAAAFADQIIFAYEADVLPYDPGGGWQLYSPCTGPCSESLGDGFLTLHWQGYGERGVNYSHRIAEPPAEEPLPPFWVEWRFVSDAPVHTGFQDFANDGAMYLNYRKIQDTLNMYGDAIISESGGAFVDGLELGAFRTFRFETDDGLHSCIWYDGKLFRCTTGLDKNEDGVATIQMHGFGGNDPPTLTMNRWDYVRYGHMTTGEAIVSSDPPGGTIDVSQYLSLDRFTVTFDQANYVHVDEVSVQVSSGAAPQVTKTRRRDNGAPETVEIVLDRPLQLGVTYTFTFATGGSPNSVTYTLVQTGACCQTNGTCIDSNDADCAENQGSFTAGAMCSAPSACCGAGGSCQNLAAICCSNAGGTPNSSGVCEGDADHDGIDGMCGDLCPNDPDNDIDGDGICGDVDPCPTLNPNDANHNGVPDCQEPTPIPTANQWGLTILALSLLAIAKANSIRRA